MIKYFIFQYATLIGNQLQFLIIVSIKPDIRRQKGRDQHQD